MLNLDASFDSKREKQLKKEVALDPRERQIDVDREKQSFQDRELSGVLSELMDRKDLVANLSPQEIYVFKKYRLTAEESVENAESYVAHLTEDLKRLKAERRYTETRYTLGRIEKVELTDEEIQEKVGLMEEWLSRAQRRLPKLRKGEEIDYKNESILSLPTEAVIGRDDAKMAEQIRIKQAHLRDIFLKLIFKYDEVLSIKRQQSDGFGISNLSAFKDTLMVENNLALLMNVESRLKKDPLIQGESFLRAHVMAAAGKKHDKSLVENFDPKKLEAAYQAYMDKYREYEGKLRPLIEPEPKKFNHGPYR